MASKNRRKRTAFVPRIIFATTVVGVVPACVLACATEEDGPTISEPSLDGVAYDGFGVAAEAFGVADIAFDVAAEAFGVADTSFTREVDAGVADVAFRETESKDSNAGDAKADAKMGVADTAFDLSFPDVTFKDIPFGVAAEAF